MPCPPLAPWVIVLKNNRIGVRGFIVTVQFIGILVVIQTLGRIVVSYQGLGSQPVYNVVLRIKIKLADTPRILEFTGQIVGQPTEICSWIVGCQGRVIWVVVSKRADRRQVSIGCKTG